MALQTELDDEERLLTDLENNVYQLAVTHIKPVDDRYYFKKCETEQLMFALPKGHRFTRRKSLTFSDMNGENMLVFNDIGFWHAVHTDNMPDSRFLTQSDRFSFTELVQTSSLPCFITDLSKKHFDSPAGRVFVPISDEAAKVTYYLICKPEKKKQFAELFAAI